MAATVPANRPLVEGTRVVEQINGPHDPLMFGGTATAAWWYENACSIDVLIEDRTSDGQFTIGMCRIDRAALVAWIKRTGGV